MGMVQVISIRYIKVFERCCGRASTKFRLALHVINGLVIIIFTIAMSVVAISYYSWILRWESSTHSTMGLAVLILTCVIGVLGMFTLGIVTQQESECWQKLKLLKIRDCHKYLGYALIALSQITIVLGVIIYNGVTGDPTLGAINMGFFFTIWSVLEVVYQCLIKEETEVTVELSKVMSIKEY